MSAAVLGCVAKGQSCKAEQKQRKCIKRLNVGKCTEINCTNTIQSLTLCHFHPTAIYLYDTVDTCTKFSAVKVKTLPTGAEVLLHQQRKLIGQIKL